MAHPGTGIESANPRQGFRTLPSARSRQDHRTTHKAEPLRCRAGRHHLIYTLTERPANGSVPFRGLRTCRHGCEGVVWGSLEATRRRARALWTCLNFRFEESILAWPYLSATTRLRRTHNVSSLVSRGLWQSSPCFMRSDERVRCV